MNRSLLVSVHGISRNAAEHAAALADISERHGRLVVAPRFAAGRERRYQQLFSPRLDAEAALLAVLDDVGYAYAEPTERIHLFGFSGGGQFAHRFALLNPHRIASLMLASAGWYTCLREPAPFPFGIDEQSRIGRRIQQNLRQFVQTPIAVWVGERDVRRDSTLRRDRFLDRHQGLTRVERGARWLRDVKGVAASLGVRSRAHFELLRRCSHDFRQCVDDGQLVRRITSNVQDVELVWQATARAGTVEPFGWWKGHCGREHDGPASVAALMDEILL